MLADPFFALCPLNAVGSLALSFTCRALISAAAVMLSGGCRVGLRR